MTQRSQKGNRQAGPGEDETNIAHVDMERLRATLTHLWPVDRPLLTGLDRAGRHLAYRRDTEPPSAVVSDLEAYLNLLIELLSRSQWPDYVRQLRRIAAFVGQNLAMAQWIAGDGSGTYRTYAIAESLARESRSGSTLSLILVDRSEMAGQVARTTDGWNEARDLGAWVCMSPDLARPCGASRPPLPSAPRLRTRRVRALRCSGIGGLAAPPGRPSSRRHTDPRS